MPQDDAEKLLNTLARGLGNDERLILCGFLGSPENAPTNAWRPRSWKPGMAVPFTEQHNAYVAVSSFRKDHDGRWNRRGDFFSAGVALMVDDVGLSPSSKVHPRKVHGRDPTMVVETSPRNFQFWYCLQEPERDKAKFSAVIKAFIDSQLLGKDPGMAGANRVGRLPLHLNGKPRHKGWVTQLVHYEPDRRFTIDDLCTIFDLTLTPPPPLRFVSNDIAEHRIKMYERVERFLRRRGMLKRNANPSGWIAATCPWKDGHSAGADTGAAIRRPAAENQFFGAWHCCHGSCAGRGWQQLTDWIADLAVEELSSHG